MSDWEDFGTDPSWDEQAEQCVLGGMMLAKYAIEEVIKVVKGLHFYKPAHTTIFEAIVDLYERGEPADAVTVSASLYTSGDLARIGGNPYLHHLIHSVPTAANAGHYAETVLRHANLRMLGTLGTRIRQIGLNPRTDLDDTKELLLAAVREIETALADVPADAAPRAGDLLDSVLELVERPEANTAIRTGLRDLDDFYPGHRPGQLIILAARPSVGKSVFALSFARHAAITSGVPTLLVSLEMDTTEIMQRLISAEAAVPLDHITDSRCDDYDWDRIAKVSGRIAEAPLYIDDSFGVGLAKLRQTLNEMRRGPGVGLVIVDYLQLMAAPKAENRQQSVSELSRGLKLLAQEFRVPIIALSQLNRKSEDRADKVPQMSDLRESGSLEQDADAVILLHREDMYEPEGPRAGECDVIVAKCRNGRRGTAAVAFQGHYSRAVSFAAEPRASYSGHDQQAA